MNQSNGEYVRMHISGAVCDGLTLARCPRPTVQRVQTCHTDRKSSRMRKPPCVTYSHYCLSPSSYLYFLRPPEDIRLNKSRRALLKPLEMPLTSHALAEAFIGQRPASSNSVSPALFLFCRSLNHSSVSNLSESV